jgi:hypothetical protein
MKHGDARHKTTSMSTTDTSKYEVGFFRTNQFSSCPKILREEYMLVSNYLLTEEQSHTAHTNHATPPITNVSLDGGEHGIDYIRLSKWCGKEAILPVVLKPCDDLVNQLVHIPAVVIWKANDLSSYRA